MFPTKEDVHGIKRQEVLREAAASFNFKGYHATSLTEIATLNCTLSFMRRTSDINQV